MTPEVKWTETAELLPPDDMPNFLLTEKGNGERLAYYFGKNIRYVPRWMSWLIWNERFWEKDENGDIIRLAKITVEKISGEPSLFKPDDVHKHFIKSQSKNAIYNMVELAKTETDIPISETKLDTKSDLLNTLNSTINLMTGMQRDFKREDYLTKGLELKFDPLASCPTFIAFLNRIFNNDQELIQFVKRALGYSITGKTSERCIFICYGNGRNGKSTLLDLIQFILGDYALRTPTSTLTAKNNDNGIPNDIARLRGARFVFASETEQTHKLNESLIKDLTGGDIITARFMRAEFFQFKPECKIWIGTNHKPRIHGTDEAIWDRIILTPFTVRIPREEIDIELPAKLQAEAEGVLAWLIEGAKEWYENGLNPPKSVLAATDTYRQESDILGQFIDDCCELLPDAVVSKSELFTKYEIWAKENTNHPISKIEFGRRLRDRGLQEAMKGHNNIRSWVGIGIKEVAVIDPDLNF